MKKLCMLTILLLTLCIPCAVADMVIEDEAFMGCTELTEVVIPEGTTSIGERAFYGCSGLTSVTIPDSVTEIGEEAFANCTGLTEMTFSAKEDNYLIELNIADNAFSGLPALKAVYMQWKMNVYLQEFFIDLFPGDGVLIGNRFKGTCGDNLTWTMDYQGVLTISGTGTMKMDETYIDGIYIKDYGWDVYSDVFTDGNMRSVVKKLVLNEGITTIGEKAFSRMRFDSVTIPSSVTRIEEGAFSYCPLYTLTIPDSVTDIAPTAFSYCNWLETVNVSQNHPACVMVGDALLRKSDMRMLAILNVGSAENYSIPAGTRIVTDIGWSWCHNLTSVTIPSSVTSIEQGAFANCYMLETVTMQEGVENIGDEAFCDCSSLKNITIPDSVTSIGESAFSYCSGLESIIIPNRVTSIGDDLFWGCKSSLTVTVVAGSYAETYCKDNGISYTYAE